MPGDDRHFWEDYPDQIAKLEQMCSKLPHNWAKTSEEVSRLGPQRSPEACKKRWQNYGRPGATGKGKNKRSRQERPSKVDHVRPIIYQKDRTPMGWQERVLLAQRSKEARVQDRPFSFFAHVQIRTETPIGLLVTSDWQLGSYGTDYDSWLAQLAELWEIPNLYMLVNGDLIHNIAVHRTLEAVLQQVLTPDEQVLMLADLAQELIESGKLLAITFSEEHDLRDMRLTGSSSLLQLFRDKRVPMFSNRGCLILQVGKWYYIIYCVHKSRYKSFLNQLHAGMRQYQLGIPANVVVTSDTHRPAHGKYPWNPELNRLLEAMPFHVPFRLGEEVFLVQTGTYEMDAEYGIREYGLLPRPKPQIVIFYPDAFHIEIADSFEAARRLMEGGL